MKRHVMLMVTSLASAVLLSLHISKDIVFGFDSAGLNHLVGVEIILVIVCGTLLLPRRWLGQVIMLLGGAMLRRDHARGPSVWSAPAVRPLAAGWARRRCYALCTFRIATRPWRSRRHGRPSF